MKQYPKFQVEFTCDVCGLPMGNSLTLSEGFWNPETGRNLADNRYWKDDYVDVRHTQCEIDHGAFEEMFDQYIKEVNNDPLEAEDFVKKNRKRKDFDKAKDKILKSNVNMV